ncbi:MAG: hypothetical protein WB443_12690, partial [Nitrososphaeraceae archaeon]
NLIFVNFILNLDRNSVFPCLELVVVDTKTIFERRILESCNKALIGIVYCQELLAVTKNRKNAMMIIYRWIISQ